MNNLIVLSVFIVFATVVYFLIARQKIHMNTNKYLIVKVYFMVGFLPYVVLLFASRYIPVLYEPLHNAPFYMLTSVALTAVLSLLIKKHNEKYEKR